MGEFWKIPENFYFWAKSNQIFQAFSHFTFERSGHQLIVVDVQGVGDLYTDPQIHTSDGLGGLNLLGFILKLFTL